jgi:putative transposase
MPNHIHLLWNMLQRNGGESAGSSFAKFTAHQFRKYLSGNDLLQLENYVSTKTDRRYQFWKRDPLAVLISTEEIFLQKLEYIHNNPCMKNGNYPGVRKSIDGAVQGFTTMESMNLRY